MRKFNNKSNVIGSLIRKRRLEKKMTGLDVCKQLQLFGIDMDGSHLYRIETSKVILKDFELIAFCMILDISMEDLREYMKEEAKG